MSWRRAMWWVWGIGALAWLIYGSIQYGSGVGGQSLGQAPTALSPMLSRHECDQLGDVEARNACAGVAAMARERRALLQENEQYRLGYAGAMVVVPILVVLGIVFAVHQLTGEDSWPQRKRRPPAPPNERHRIAARRRQGG